MVLNQIITQKMKTVHGAVLGSSIKQCDTSKEHI